MEFRSLISLVRKSKPVKIYMIDHVIPGLFTGYVSNPNGHGKNVLSVDLEPYEAVLLQQNKFLLKGAPEKYRGLHFDGRFATTDFITHVNMVQRYLKQREMNGNHENLQIYFGNAKEL